MFLLYPFAVTLSFCFRRGLFIDKLASELNECLKKGPVEGLSAVNYPLGTFRVSVFFLSLFYSTTRSLSLQYVLSSYLIAGADPIAKHAFVYYTLLDIESSSVDDVSTRPLFQDRLIVIVL